MSQMQQAFAPAKRVPVDTSNQTKFTQAKMDALKSSHCDHMVLFPDNQTKVGNKLARKSVALGYLVYPPFKIPILDEEHKQESWWTAQCNWAEDTARGLMLQPEIVEGDVIYLSELQKRDIRNAANAYEAFKCLSNLVYKKGDFAVLFAFEQELAKLLADKKLLKKDVSTWLSMIDDLVTKIRSVADEGELYLTGTTVRARIVHSIPSFYQEAKSILKTVARLRESQDNTDLEIRQELLSAERTRKQEEADVKGESSDDAEEVVKSAQASFSERQNDYGRQGDGRDYHGRRGDGRDYYGRQGDGSARGRGRGRGRGRDVGRGGRDLSQVKCFRCKEKGHVAAKCPAPAVVEDEDES